jgi:hypothetical protein
MTRATVFIAYNPADEVEKEGLVTHLGVLQRQGLIETWTDDQIKPGADKAREMEEAINRAKVTVLLITPNFLSSDFVSGEEMKRILERRQTQAMVLYPIIARPCAWKRVPWLARLRVRPRDEKPVWREGGRYVDEELAAIAEEIAEIMEKAESAPATSHSQLIESRSQPAETRSLSYGGSLAEQASQIENRYALLIGVRDYAATDIQPLPHTVTDVVELDKVLRTAGYTTKLLHSDLPDRQPTYSKIWGELEGLAKMTGPGDLLLVYFGGHGNLDDEGNAYLIPGDLYNYFGMKRTAINLDDFTKTIATSGAQARILILDACHSGIGRSDGRMDPAFERHVIMEAEGSATLAACRQGQKAYEHENSPHGVFTYYLLEGLRGAADREGKRFVTFNDLSSYVTAQVRAWAIEHNRNQWPNTNAKFVGDPPLLKLP